MRISSGNYITTLQTLIFSAVLTHLATSTTIELDNENFQFNDPINSHKLRLYSEDGRKQAATSAPNFIQLVIMRFIYGIASTIGVEDRLEDTFNGAFIPPNADDGLIGFGGGDNEGGLFGDIFEGDDYL